VAYVESNQQVRESSLFMDVIIFAGLAAGVYFGGRSALNVLRAKPKGAVGSVASKATDAATTASKHTLNPDAVAEHTQRIAETKADNIVDPASTTSPVPEPAPATSPASGSTPDASPQTEPIIAGTQPKLTSGVNTPDPPVDSAPDPGAVPPKKRGRPKKTDIILPLGRMKIYDWSAPLSDKTLYKMTPAELARAETEAKYALDAIFEGGGSPIEEVHAYMSPLVDSLKARGVTKEELLSTSKRVRGAMEIYDEKVTEKTIRDLHARAENKQISKLERTIAGNDYMSLVNNYLGGAKTWRL